MNKALPRVEQELENLIADWERLHQVANSQHQNFWDHVAVKSSPSRYDRCASWHFSSSRPSSSWEECAWRTSSRRRNKSTCSSSRRRSTPERSRRRRLCFRRPGPEALNCFLRKRLINVRNPQIRSKAFDSSSAEGTQLHSQGSTLLSRHVFGPKVLDQYAFFPVHIVYCIAKVFYSIIHRWLQLEAKSLCRLQAPQELCPEWWVFSRSPNISSPYISHLDSHLGQRCGDNALTKSWQGGEGNKSKNRRQACLEGNHWVFMILFWASLRFCAPDLGIFCIDWNGDFGKCKILFAAWWDFAWEKTKQLWH